MIGQKYIAVTILTIWISSCFADPDPYSDGKYDPNKYSSGRYIPSEEGRYVHRAVPYVHVDDARELGVYHHIHIPYNGGFGPYNGTNIPYIHDDHPYRQDLYTTTTTTTERPRVRYVDQGKYRIIRQEEAKKQHKYDFLYLTENGIYAEEQAKLRDEKNQATGTNSKGYYEYTGDDGKLYRVDYTVGEQGFVPEADHIPTTPPVPLAIQRALDYVAAQQRGSSLRNF